MRRENLRSRMRLVGWFLYRLKKSGVCDVEMMVLKFELTVSVEGVVPSSDVWKCEEERGV
jgi:hypothetical protein